ncbi:MarR family transcriptional regulator [Kribbella pittospori]|uniref:MarR family transcriptional regulator n=1 Tax=Kribbella pittospori TaxID=722689 RepID=UPI0013F494F3|nr:MarR family transcriptional regulator [Kribbella pittospori]
MGVRPEDRATRWLDQHGPLRLSDLAGQLDVSAPSASRIINRLADDGLVLRRTPTTIDGRSS